VAGRVVVGAHCSVGVLVVEARWYSQVVKSSDAGRMVHVFVHLYRTDVQRRQEN
jgi:hypothetical protein